MNNIWNIIIDSYHGYVNYLWYIISHPFANDNYFSLLIGLSLLVWALELLLPWRIGQRPIRKQFWQDTFYMFFNFFLFNLFIFIALSNTTATMFGRFMGVIGLPSDYILDLTQLPLWAQFISFFLIADFLQWSIHNLLHRVPWMWKFHRLHHSVTEMGFAAHLRYHFMETVFYKTGLYIILSYLLHFELQYAFFLHAFTILIGHLNHANVGWDYGPLKYVLNNPKMHIWHHAKDLPSSHPHGMNFGITLSLWDYLFGTNYIPHEGRDIPLGFEDIDTYPEGFIEQQLEPFRKQQRRSEDLQDDPMKKYPIG